MPAAILAKFDAIGAARGVDTDVAPGSLDDGALSFAASCQCGRRSRCSRHRAGPRRAELCLEHGRRFERAVAGVADRERRLWRGRSCGRDGASGTSYALKVTTAGIFSGLQTTEGHDVFLYLQTTGPMADLILGRVGIEASSTAGLDTPDPNGKVAFALAIDPASGEVYIADYLSLHHPVAGSTPAANDDQITLAPNTVGVVVTLTDGDGDQVRRRAPTLAARSGSRTTARRRRR